MNTSEPDPTDTDSTSASESTARQKTADSSDGLIGRATSFITSHSVAATGSVTFIMTVVLAGLLWAGTGLNNGIEAPSVVALPTPWAAAIVGGTILTILLAFLGFAFAFQAFQSSGSQQASSRQSSTGTEPTQTDSSPSSERIYGEAGGDQPGQVVDMTGQSTGSVTDDSDDAAVRRRVDESYPDHVTDDTSTKKKPRGTGREQQ